MKSTLIASTASHIPHKSEPRNLTAEELIVYAARVSNPSNQANVETGEKLLRYCMAHGHWSVFETASMTVEVETSLFVAAQILRHRSFTFQQFSARYSVATAIGELFEPVEVRLKAQGGNRQGSGDVAHQETHAEVGEILDILSMAYNDLIAGGVAPECARQILPTCTKTRLYITGSARSWVHYFEQRCSLHAQKEHRLLAESIRDGAFKQVFHTLHSIITTAKSPKDRIAELEAENKKLLEQVVELNGMLGDTTVPRQPEQEG